MGRLLPAHSHFIWDVFFKRFPNMLQAPATLFKIYVAGVIIEKTIK